MQRTAASSVPAERLRAGASARPAPVLVGQADNEKTMADRVDRDDRKAQRFRELALPYLDDLYAFARYLLRDATDAEDAVQECYLRAFRHFDGFRGGEIKPWLLAILRNTCRAEHARRAGPVVTAVSSVEEDPDQAPLWCDGVADPETQTLSRLDAETLERLVADLPEPFREAIVLRELNELGYREIAAILGVPVGTVMSRLARARAMLRQAWLAESGGHS